MLRLPQLKVNVVPTVFFQYFNLITQLESVLMLRYIIVHCVYIVYTFVYASIHELVGAKRIITLFHYKEPVN